MRITKRTVDQLETPPKDTFFWDDTLKGFGVKVTISGRKVFVLQGRIDGKVRRYTIGQYGSPWSPDQARAQALSMLSELAKGIDPTAEKRARRLQGSFADLIEQYVAEETQYSIFGTDTDQAACGSFNWQDESRRYHAARCSKNDDRY